MGTMTQMEIADKYGYGQGTVSKALIDYGVRKAGIRDGKKKRATHTAVYDEREAALALIYGHNERKRRLLKEAAKEAEMAQRVRMIFRGEMEA